MADGYRATKVDGLEVSDYLVETAKRHIEGEVDIDGVDRLIKTYYLSEAAREIPKRPCPNH